MSAVFTRAPWPEIRRVRAALGLSLRETNRALMRYGSADAAIAALLAEPDRESFEAAERVRLAAPAMLSAMKRIEPYLDAIVCYASTCGEHEPNDIVREFRAATSQATGSNS